MGVFIMSSRTFPLSNRFVVRFRRQYAGYSTQPFNNELRGDSMSRKLVIVGGGAGGASVAAEAKRGDSSLSIVMLEQGKYVSTAA